MKKILSLLLLCTMHAALCTLSAQSYTVTDTLTLTVSSIVPEPNPNANEYIFSIFGTDNKGVSQKVQIRYNSTTMYGTFTNDDFYNWDGSLGSGSYNYIRRTNSDIGFYPFKNELSATVIDIAGATDIEVNGLINVYGSWTRVLLHGVIPAPEPDDTLSLDLGLVSVIPMNQLGYEYLRLDAANDTYSLAFGIVGTNTLQACTYYQADLLRPDLVEQPDDTIAVSSATLVVTDTLSSNHNLLLTLLGQDNILYLVHMHTGLIEATDTVQVNCASGLMQNLKEMYGIYQLAGVSADYQVAIALTPGVIEQSQRTFTNDSVNLAYTRLLDVAANQLIYVMQASGRFEPDSSAFLPRMMVYADLLGINGTLYQVSFPVGGSQLPTAVDTTIVECGDHGVLRLDYTYGAGYLGMVIGNEDYDAHVVLYNGLQMQGNFGTDMFLYNDDVPGEKAISYLTLYNVGDADSRLSDIAACEMRMDSVGDTVRIELNVVTTSSHMYCFRTRLLPLSAITGDEHYYTINDPLRDDGMLVAFRLDKTGNEQTFYLQCQRSDAWDAEGNMIGATGEIWSYIFMQDSVDGIAGTYGYSAGTLMEEQFHMLTENGTEIWLMPMAGTLTITPIQAITIPASVLGINYRTHLYTIQSDMVMENGQLYHITGANILMCVDNVSEAMIELSEDLLSALDEVLGEQGLRIRKVLHNGLLLIETTDSTYDLQGHTVR